MNNPTSQQIKAAFIAAAEAEEAIAASKKHLAHLFDLSEQAEAARWVVDNVARAIPPDADAQDVIYERLHKSQVDLAEAVRAGSLVDARSALTIAHVKTEEAFLAVK